jgi:hypothetical protein
MSACLPGVPAYLLRLPGQSGFPYRLFSCATCEELLASAGRAEAEAFASVGRFPVVAHSRHAAARRAMYLVSLRLRHASGELWCAPRSIGGRSGSPHARDLHALCRLGLARRKRRFCDIARDGSWLYALTPAGDASARALLEGAVAATGPAVPVNSTFTHIDTTDSEKEEGR